MGKRSPAAVVDISSGRGGAAMQLDVSMQLKKGTNINDIEVPPELRMTHKTGIDFFDASMGGEGLTPSASILFTGGPGAGKTTVMLQLANSWTKQGHIALYNTNEEAAVQVKKTVERLRLNDGFIIGQDRLVPNVLNHCDFLAKKYPGKRILLINDSLQTLDDGKYSNGGTNGASQVRVTEMVINWCKSTFGVSVLIGQVTKAGEFAGKMQVKHAVDCHAHLYIDDKPKSETYGERIFEVEKNRYGCNGISYILGMDKNRGLYEKANFGGVTNG